MDEKNQPKLYTYVIKSYNLSFEKFVDELEKHLSKFQIILRIPFFRDAKTYIKSTEELDCKSVKDIRIELYQMPPIEINEIELILNPFWNKRNLETLLELLKGDLKGFDSDLEFICLFQKYNQFTTDGNTIIFNESSIGSQFIMQKITIDKIKKRCGVEYSKYYIHPGSPSESTPGNYEARVALAFTAIIHALQNLRLKLCDSNLLPGLEIKKLFL